MTGAGTRVRLLTMLSSNEEMTQFETKPNSRPSIRSAVRQV